MAADTSSGGGGVSRLFGYVVGVGGQAGGTGVPADAFARLGYEETRVGVFADEEVEWPTAEEEEGEGEDADVAAT